MTAGCYPDVFAGILVGGRGKRMGGRDKAQLVRSDGETFLQHIAGALAPRVTEVVLAARPAQEPYNAIDATIVHDHFVDAGPLGGLEALLRHGPTPWCFLVACDLPDFDVGVLDALVAARTPTSLAVVPKTASGLEPACALYARDLLEEVRTMLRAKEYALWQLVGRVPHAGVTLEPQLAASLRNVNGPTDWPLSDP